ncbi:hypothetical protein J4G02_07780 [Candidatus Poribacteria bacterium]|nr:hypothetical protein [Candidatus Poribacteria bacterium]
MSARINAYPLGIDTENSVLEGLSSDLLGSMLPRYASAIGQNGAGSYKKKRGIAKHLILNKSLTFGTNFINCTDSNRIHQAL